jgi:hypothetical protein
MGIRRGYLSSTEYAQEEAILHYLAPELRHLRQAKVPKVGVSGVLGAV